MDEFDTIVEHIKQSTNLELLRKATKFVVRYSVKGVVTTLVLTYTPASTNRKQKLQLVVGTWAIAGKVSDVVADWADTKFEEAVRFINEVREGLSARQAARTSSNKTPE